MKVAIWVLDRLVPTLLMGASAALLTAGALSYAPSAFGEWRSPAPTAAGGDPLFASPSQITPVPETASPGGGTTPLPDVTGKPQASPSASQGPSAAPSGPIPSETPPSEPSFPPTQTPGDGTIAPSSSPPTTRPSTAPSATPKPTGTPVPGRAGAPATRIRIPSLGIDLPVVPSDLVVPGNVDFYPLCDVAMYMVGFVDPGEAGTTYIYGHAQDGMFAPLLRASKYNDGASMIGALVEIYTNDNKLRIYQITLVKRHSTDLSITRVPPGVHQLVLQTSEGWSGHLEKLQIAAQPIAVLSASYAAAHPAPHPRVCLPHN